MSDLPIAFHVTFGTYGTRLHGDARGTVDRALNRPGDPIVGRVEQWKEMERHRLRFPPVRLTSEQRGHVQNVIPMICVRGGWRHHVVAAATDHVHVLLTADRAASELAGATVRRLLKRWLTGSLQEHWPRPEGAAWWAEGGSVKWVWKQDYFETVYHYVDQQRYLDS